MKIITIAVCLFFSISCMAQTQAEMSKEAYANFQEADTKLNDVYEQIVSEYRSDSAFIENLKTAQKLWVEFRDAELKMKYPNREAGYYGSIHPMCRALYLQELTEKRTETLMQWLEGDAEGNACRGSVKKM